MINFSGIDHHSVMVQDISVSLQFYHQVLGLAIDDSRPDLPFDGAWLKVGAQAIHLIELNNPDADSIRPEHGGRDRHVALSCQGLDDLIVTLKQQQIKFTQSKSGRAAIFFRDPDGNAIEVIEK